MIIKSNYSSVYDFCETFGLELKEDFFLIESEGYEPKAQCWVNADGVKYIINMPLDISKKKPVATKVTEYRGGILGVWVFNPRENKKLAFA